MNKLQQFKFDTGNIPLPEHLNDPFNVKNKPHALCLMAVAQLQEHLSHLGEQATWQHNFGLKEEKTGKAIGKMFGVLVVQKEDQSVGFLAAFSGKLANTNNHKYFVPPVYDSLAEGEFLNAGMLQLKAMNDKVKELKLNSELNSEALKTLKEQRKSHSQKLQKLLFQSYQFSNAKQVLKDPFEIFGPNPPAGAGECAAPKLLHYAFQNELKPIGIAEFWWGAPPSIDSQSRKHGHFYPACEDKCRGILGWMLG